MLSSIFLLVLGLALVFLAAELFTNAVEWFGKRLKMREGAVGSVLAAVGTALPETSVAVVAVAQGSNEVGIGAILGAPMMLSTLAMFVTGVSVLIFAARGLRKKEITADYQVVGRDLRTFFCVYALALVASFVPGKAAKIPFAIVLLLLYCYYVYRTFTCSDCGGGGDMRPLHFHRSAARPKLRWVVTQLAAGLVVMLMGADLFVENVRLVAERLGTDALVLSLIIVPIATELPEKFNSITWMRHKKDTLALGNVTGAMVFQSSILPAIGILFTPWELEPKALASIGIALLASLTLWGEMTLRKRLSAYTLLLGGLLYLLYPVLIFEVMPAFAR